MPLDLSLVGKPTAPVVWDYTWKDTVLYALGVGAKQAELDYLYEGRGPRVLPEFRGRLQVSADARSPGSERRELGHDRPRWRTCDRARPARAERQAGDDGDDPRHLQKQRLRAYKRDVLLGLFLVTVILGFSTTWVALFLSKQVTVPIQALAEATREISRGNFDHRMDVRAQDELGMLVRSFNRMTEQLGEGRRQINEFTQSLEQAIEERERRRKLMEAILENIPTGVVSLNSSGEVARVNSAVRGDSGGYGARGAHACRSCWAKRRGAAVLHLMRRSLRMGAASREIEIAAGGQAGARGGDGEFAGAAAVESRVRGRD